ncbi:MAG: lipoyl(octanoyl) transferase LipB [Candidatus Acidiferrales bacterium]
MKQPEKICWQVNAGVLPYAPACALQQQLVEARKAGAIPDVLLFCEHQHTITLGRNGKKENLRASNHLLAQMNVTFHETNRGGDITYHGPGQIVGYPILDLTELRRDVRWYVQQLEEIMIRATANFKVTAARIPDRHGIWVGLPPTEEKLAALGVHLSRWVTSHGFAYNVATDLRYFDLIVPCGIAGKRATSLERVLDRAVRTDEVRPRLAAHFGEMFERDMLEVSRAELEDTLQNHHRHAHALAPRPSELLELKGSLA